jgi:hypothetical protein
VEILAGPRHAGREDEGSGGFPLAEGGRLILALKTTAINPCAAVLFDVQSRPWVKSGSNC